MKKIYKLILALFFRDEFLDYIGVKHGSNVKIYGNPYHMFGSEPFCIRLGSNVYITDRVRFITHDGGTLIFRRQFPDLEITKPIIVGDNVYIGQSAILLPGVKIGNNCIIGAGAIVTKDVPDNSVVAGVPARVIKNVEEYLSKIQKESLHIGHLEKKNKEEKLRNIYKDI